MDLQKYITPQLIDECKKYSSIVVLGIPNSGKTTFATQLSKNIQYTLIKSDDYFIKDNQQESLEYLYREVTHYYNNNIPFIVEGVLGYRLLRKGAQTASFLPDLIINLNCNMETMIHFYEQDNESHKINRAVGYVKGLTSIFQEYKNILLNNPQLKRPQYIELDTSI